MTENPYASPPTSGGFGPMPGDNDTREAAAVAPADVQKAFKLWIVSIAIGVLGTLVGLIFGFANREDLETTIMDNSPTLTPDEVSTTVTATLIAVAVIGLIIAGLELLFTFKMRAGRNWARIVLTVLGVLGVLFSLYGLATAFTIGSVLTLISIIVVIAAIVFMFKPASSAYFSTPQR